MLIHVLWQLFHNIYKSNHRAVYLELPQWCVSIISQKKTGKKTSTHTQTPSGPCWYATELRKEGLNSAQDQRQRQVGQIMELWKRPPWQWQGGYSGGPRTGTHAWGWDAQGQRQEHSHCKPGSPKLEKDHQYPWCGAEPELLPSTL